MEEVLSPSAYCESAGASRALTCMQRAFFPMIVALGLSGLGVLGLHQLRAPDRLRNEAAAAGLASAELSIREMG